MFRYVAFLWSPTDPQSAVTARLLRNRLRSASSDKWVPALDSDGLCILHTGARPPAWNAYSLTPYSGVVLGTLFRSNGSASASALVLRDEDRRSIIESTGKTLIERFWGRYVAFIRKPQTPSVHIVRDPQGGLPCFSTRLRGVQLFYSDVDDMLALDAIRPTINQRFLTAFVGFPLIAGNETGLNEIKEVPPGHCLELDAEGERSCCLYWDAAAIARTSTVVNEKEAAAALRSTTEACVTSWASCFPGILHRLSGGLDSSIVLSCLRSAATRPAVTCLNYFFQSSNEDERAYARMAASATHCELLEKEERVVEVQLERILRVRRFARPDDFEEPTRHAAFEAQLAGEKRAGALFCGVGGDNIFYQNPLNLTPADYLFGHLFRRGFLNLVTAVARVEREPVWRILGTAIKTGLLRARWNPLDDVHQYMSLVTRDVVEVTKRQLDFIHPSLRNVDGLAPGKIRHIQMMTALVPNPYSPFDLHDAPERIAPLVSQPLIELCLRIPIYVLSARGVDRSAVRHAFEGAVPSPILRRHIKGGIDAYILQLLQRNLPFIRELMLDGLMIKEGLLDRSKLEKVLAPDQPWMPPEGLEVMCDHLSTEAWMRSWHALSTSSRRTSAAKI